MSAKAYVKTLLIVARVRGAWRDPNLGWWMVHVAAISLVYGLPYGYTTNPATWQSRGSGAENLLRDSTSWMFPSVLRNDALCLSDMIMKDVCQ